LKTFFKILDQLEEIILVILLSFMTIMAFVNVLSRYIFTLSISFSDELVIMAFVWASMFGIAVGYKRCAHLGMSFLVDHMPKNMQAVMALFSMVCSTIMVVIMLRYGISMVQQQISLGSTTAALRLPSCVQGLSIPVSCVFILIRTIQSGFREFRRLRGEAALEKKGADAQ